MFQLRLSTCFKFKACEKYLPGWNKFYMNLFRIFQLCFFLPVLVLVVTAASSNASSITNIESFLKGIRDVSENDIDFLKAEIAKLPAHVAGFALRDASENGCLKTVNLLLDNRSDIDLRAAGIGLRDASKNGHIDIVKTLLEKRLDIEQHLVDSSVWEAVKNKDKHFEIAELLLNKRGDVMEHIAREALTEAMKYNHCKFAKNILKLRTDIKSFDSGDVITILREAYKNDCLGVIEYLLSTRNDLDNYLIYQTLFQTSERENGHILLDRSRFDDYLKGRFEIIKLLIKYKGDLISVKFLNQCESEVKSHRQHENSELLTQTILLQKENIDSASSDRVCQILLKASETGNSRIVEKILERRSESISSDFASQSVLEALNRGYFKIVELILQYKIDSLSADSAGQVFFGTCKRDRSGIVKTLLLTGIDLSISYIEAELLKATDNKNLEIVNAIIDSRFEIDNPETVGQLFVWASENGHSDIIKKFVDLKNSKVSSKLAGEGLQRASENVHSSIVSFLLERYKLKEDFDVSFACQGVADAIKNGHLGIVRLFLELENKDIDARAAGQILLKASEKGHTDTVRFLLEIDTDASHSFTEAKYDYLDIVKILHERGSIKIDTSYAGQGLVLASEHGRTEIVKIFLENRSDIDASFVRPSLLVALENGHMGIVKLMFEFRSDAISDLIVNRYLLEASKRGHLELVKLLFQRFEIINFESFRQAFLEALKNGHYEVVKFFLLLDVQKSGIDTDFISEFFVETEKKIQFDVFKLIIETRKDVNVLLKRQGLDIALNSGHQDLVKTLIGSHRVGLTNNGGCCRVISFISCLFHIPRLREVLYSSDYSNVPSKRLAELFVQMQLGNSNLHMEDRFVQFYKQVYPNYKKFWSNILQLRNNILDLLPEETKNVFQVTLRISSDSSKSPQRQSSSFEDVTRNFITISRKYKSISEAISSKFSFDVKDNLSSTAEVSNSDSFGLEKRNQIDCERDTFNQIEILNRPEVLFFGIKRSDVITPPKMELDLEITLPPPPSNNSNSNEMEHVKYVLQAFSYSDEGFGHHMSFIRDLSSYSSVCEWYKHNDSRIKPSFEEDHLESMKKYANSYATFTFYVRSDVVNTPCPDIPEKLLPARHDTDVDILKDYVLIK